MIKTLQDKGFQVTLNMDNAAKLNARGRRYFYIDEVNGAFNLVLKDYNGIVLGQGLSEARTMELIEAFNTLSNRQIPSRLKKLIAGVL